MGVSGEAIEGRWVLTFLGKVALGGVKEDVRILGERLETRLVPVPATTTRRTRRRPAGLPGGLLAQPSNEGDFGRQAFAVAPEAGATLGYQVTDQLRLYAGYTLLYLSDVLRPGDQIDTALSVRRSSRTGFPTVGEGAPHPAVPLRATDFWAQGLNFGVEFRY